MRRTWCLWLERCSWWAPTNETKKTRFAPQQKNPWIWKQAAEHGIVVTVRKNSACSYQRWVWLMGLLNPLNSIPWKFAKGRFMEILSLENLSLYAWYPVYPIKFVIVDVVDHLLSSFPFATLWTAALTPTQRVSCHLHSHSITMLYVKRDNAVQDARQ